MIPKLPIIGITPQRSLFILLEAVPDGAFLILFAVIELMAIIAFVYLCISVKCNCKLLKKFEELVVKLHKYELYCFQLPVYVFPKLFAKKKIQLEGKGDSEEILYLDQRLQLSFGEKEWRSQCVVILFTTLAVMVCCITALGFFRYFPVTISLECMEEDNNFNTLFCYTDTKKWRYEDLPLDCEEYQNMNKSEKIVNTDDSNSNGFESDIICYALSVDIAKSSAVAFGIYKFLSILVFATVFAGKLLVQFCLRCAHGKCGCERSSIKCCSAICYSLMCVSAFVVSGIVSIFVLNSKSDLKNLGTGELYYRLAYVIGFFVCAVYFLYIPLYTLHFIDGEDTYSYLATSDEQMKRSRTNVNGASTYETT